MSAALQQEAFLLGAALVVIFQAVKFTELNRCDPITSRYVALLPGTKVRDFAGPYAYYIALAAFLGVTLVAYSAVCQLSPDTLAGAAKFFGFSDDKSKFEGVAYPIYVAALFMGLSQPGIPVIAWFVQDAPKNFFHDRIEVPGRIVGFSEGLVNAIQVRAGADKRRLADEVRKLAAGGFLLRLQSHGDVAFYKVQRETLEIADGDALERFLKESSPRELRALIERLVLLALIAVMRKSGPQGLPKLAELLDVRGLASPPRDLGYLVAGFILSGLLFSFGLLIIAHAFSLVDGFIATLFHKSQQLSLWPSDLDAVSSTLGAVALPIFACLLVAVCLLPRRQDIGGPIRARDSSLTGGFLGFAHMAAPILGLCFAIALLLNVGQMFYEYGGPSQLPSEARTASRLILPVMQSFIPIAVCLFTTWYLCSHTPGAVFRGPSLLHSMLLIGGTVGFISSLYDLTFVEDYLKRYPEYGPGWEHVVFYALANALVSILAFVSVVLFFKACEKLPQAVAGSRQEFRHT
jgi:hypothetical protein